MNYLLDRKNKRKKRGMWVGGVILLLVLFFFGASIFGGLSFVTQEIFRPILAGGNAVGGKVKNLGAYFYSKKLLKENNIVLSSRISDMEARMADYASLREENTAFREMLGRTPEGKKLVVGAILSQPTQSAYDTLLIDAGSDVGIREGAMAFARGHVPLGIVQSVTPNSSKVILFSSAGEKTNAVLVRAEPQILEEGNIFYDLVGRGGGNFEMTLPRDVEFGAGDLAVLPGIDSLPLAKVESVISEARDPFKKVLLSSPVNFHSLRFVEIEI